MTKKFTVTTPDGHTLTRTSKNRTYTRAVIARLNYEEAFNRANKLYKT